MVALAPEDRPCPGVAVRSASMTAALSHKASPPMEDVGHNLPIVCRGHAHILSALGGGLVPFSSASRL